MLHTGLFRKVFDSIPLMSLKRSSAMMKSEIVLLVIIGLGTLAVWVWQRWYSVASGPPQPEQSRQTKTPSVQPLSVPEISAYANFEAVRTALAATTTPDIARKELDELRRYLSTLPSEAAVGAIRQFLDSKQDAPSGLGFTIGSEGFLTAAPSLRVFLLDYLSRLDRQAASRYAETILGSMDSPDEWAVSLRNYAMANSTPDARAFLERKMQELLRYEPWQKNPSTGYLEAFDVSVHSGGTNLMPALTQLVRQQDNPAVAHAAYLALDRLTISNPAATLEHLLNYPDAMRGREQTRANYFARADITDPQQRQILENYLLAPDRSAAELQTFSGIFPNANFMVSHNLLTRTATPDGATLTRDDREALEVVEGWVRNERFSRLRSALEKIRERLQSFVQPAPRDR